MQPSSYKHSVMWVVVTPLTMPSAVCLHNPCI